MVMVSWTLSQWLLLMKSSTELFTEIPGCHHIDILARTQSHLNVLIEENEKKKKQNTKHQDNEQIYFDAF